MQKEYYLEVEISELHEDPVEEIQPYSEEEEEEEIEERTSEEEEEEIPMSNIQLIYTSRALNTSFEYIRKLAKKNRESNEQVGVRSVLLFNHDFFLQALEGPAEQVLRIYDRILRNENHKDIKLIVSRVNGEPELPFEGVLLCGHQRTNREIYKQFKEVEHFNPYALDAEKAMEFLLQIVGNVSKRESTV